MSSTRRREAIRQMLTDSDDDDAILFNFTQRISHINTCSTLRAKIIRKYGLQGGIEKLQKINGIQDDFITSSKKPDHPSELSRLQNYSRVQSAALQDNTVSSSSSNVFIVID